jgi:hypothetical protein
VIFRKPARKIYKVFLHATPADRGYHYFVKRDGSIVAGLDIEEADRQSAIAIFCLGLNAKQKAAIHKFCWSISEACGHEISFHGNTKLKKCLNLDKYQRMIPPEQPPQVFRTQKTSWQTLVEWFHKDEL